jgi:hypothetical protein
MHEQRAAAPDHASALVLEGGKPGAVARQKLEKIGTQLKVRCVTPRRDEAQKRDDQNEDQPTGAEIDHLDDERLHERGHPDLAAGVRHAAAPRFGRLAFRRFAGTLRAITPLHARSRAG